LPFACYAVGAALLFTSGFAWAQESSDPEAGAASENQEPDRPTSDELGSEDLSERETNAEPALRPAPSAPAPSDQSPRPYLETPPPAAPLRNVEIGPHLGLWWRSSSDADAVSYQADLAFGADIRINLLEWLGVRGIVSRTTPPVRVRDGLGLVDTEVEQPDLGITLLALRVEPTLPLTRRFRLWGGPEVGWARVVAPRPSTRPLPVHASERRGTVVELALGAGLSAELVERWLVTHLALRAGIVPQQTGEVFRSAQAIDEMGTLTALAALPKFSGSFGALFGLELVL
jgi:hypothetical protein